MVGSGSGIKHPGSATLADIQYTGTVTTQKDTRKKSLIVSCYKRKK
jgi:hypothetical protein